jgi:LysM repeat protein
VVSERQDPKDELPPPPPSLADGTRPPAPLPPPAPIVHKVRRGETLQMIANRYDVSADTIATANKITRRSRLIAGQILKIPPEASR